MRVIERKIRYDSTIADYPCEALKIGRRSAILMYELPGPLTVGDVRLRIELPTGSRTFAYYWTERLYNIYLWMDRKRGYLGAYFNLAKNTKITKQMVEFRDLIVDLLVLPDGRSAVLDLDELPEPIERFENGQVKKVLDELSGSAHSLLPPLVAQNKLFMKQP
ncbi:MAG: DUF402 domain-containing protein [Sporolactobacillus sp.]|nr:DUF402 domain-containing protein [Sporolactobacillus sp.]